MAVINCGGTDGNAVSLISDKSYKNISNINLTVYVSGRDKTALKVEIGTLSEGVFSATKTISSTYDSSAKKLTIGSLSVTKNSTNTSGNVAIDPATSGYIRISMANSGGKDKTGKFVGVKITAEPKNVTSATLTGIKINGTSWDLAGLSDNKATISTEFAGPPTVQYVYTATYDDETSETGKVEEIVASKQDGSYKATSTIFASNVTLTFTNVSNTLFSMTGVTDPTDDLASGNSSDVTATFSPGGSAVVYNGKSSGAAMVTNESINLAGSGNSYFKAIFTSPLAEGDVIDCSNHDGTFYISNTNDKSNSQTMPYTIPNGSVLIGKKAVFIQKNSANVFSWFTITRPKTIDSQVLGGVKKGETTLTEATDYTVSSTTIILAEAHKAIVAPTDVKLINHITYDDASTDDDDVPVTLAKDGDFFTGTATIGATTYTVKVPVDNSTPLLSLSAASGSINLNSYTPTGSVTVTVTGANLSNGTFNAPVADGVTVTPASVEISDGTMSQEFTITTSATTAASTVLNFAYTGAATQSYTLNYTKVAQRVLAQTDVTEATTWDWTKAGGASIQLTDATSPRNGEEFLLAALPEITNDETFNSQALKVSCQWPNRGSSYYLQGNSVKFNVTMPGTVQVWFSNTSNRDDTEANRRYLYVNGTNSGVYTLNQTFTNTEAMSVPAGEVVINAFTGEENATMVRINKIIFTPTPEPADATTSGEETYLTTSANMAGWRAFYDASNDYSVDANTTVYVAEQNPVGDKITLTSIDGIPAGVAVVLKTTSSADSYKMTLTKETAGTYTYSGTNKLEYTTSTVDQKYRLGYGASGVGFYPYSGTPASGAVILNVSSASARALTFAFDDETTGISATLMNSEESTVNNVFDLQGRRVAQPTKGLYIVNGKKVVIK